MRRKRIKGTPADRTFAIPVHDCGKPAVRFGASWLCPDCQTVGPKEEPLTSWFPNRRARRGRG